MAHGLDVLRLAPDGYRIHHDLHRRWRLGVGICLREPASANWLHYHGLAHHISKTYYTRVIDIDFSYVKLKLWHSFNLLWLRSDLIRMHQKDISSIGHIPVLAMQLTSSRVGYFFISQVLAVLIL